MSRRRVRYPLYLLGYLFALTVGAVVGVALALGGY